MRKFGVLPDHDALVKEREKMSWDESQVHYIQTEMLDPLMGGMVIGSGVEEIGGAHYPRLSVRSIHGKVFSVIISSDDEMNDGGRLIIEEEVSNG